MSGHVLLQVDLGVKRRRPTLSKTNVTGSSTSTASELDEDLMPAGSADWDAWEFADEERVMEIAAAWSVDPTRLDERTDIDFAGLLGWR